VLAQARIVLATAKISLVTVVESIIGTIDRGRIDRRLRGWGQQLLDIVQMTIDVQGREAVDWSRAYVVMSNHQSLLDIPVLAVAVPGSLRFVAKQELFRMPLWGPAMRAAGIISIDRQNRERAIASLRDAGAALQSGVNIWIAPEGTRSPDGDLLPLKKGGFMLAVETGAPILPVVLDGTRNVRGKHERGLVKGVHATVRFGTPITSEGRDRDELMRAVEAALRAGLS
jgi:1-acyl-sn-glycerol-3-phosphate acyltransferase